MGLFNFNKKEKTDVIKEIRSFIATTNILIDPSDKVMSQIGSQIFQFVVDRLKGNNLQFASLYEQTKDTNHKQGFGKALSTNDFVKCYLDWQKRDGYGANTPGQSLFVESGEGQIPDTGAKFSWSVFITFVK